jgi:hypothetical protein
LDHSEILSIDDWIKISIKFSGVCLHCKKKISSGEYGYWSKTSKSVLHDQCYNSLFSGNPKEATSEAVAVGNTSSSLSPNTQEMNERGSGSGKSKAFRSFSTTTAHKEQLPKRETNAYGAANQKKIRCFTCGDYVDLDDDGTLPNLLLKMSNRPLDASDTFFCSSCLNDANEELFERYTENFNRMLNK